MTAHDDWLAEAARARVAEGLHRELRPRTDEPMLDLAGNDYLGLARDPRLVGAAAEAARTWGAGATGSRLVSGTTDLHARLEAELAAFTGAESALVFSSGYLANVAVLQALTDEDTLVVSDAGNHASLIDGCRLSRATVVVSPHADPDAVAASLAGRTQTRAVVVTDSIFSVDGDQAPVAELHRVCREHDALLVVDEAHAFGVVGDSGSGVVAASGLDDASDVVRTVTLSKALGSQGGAVLASSRVVDHLVNTGRSFIFDTGLAPACVGAARAALSILCETPELAALARRRAVELAAGVGAAPPDAAVVPVIVGEAAVAVAAAQRCRDEGIAVGCFRPPSVPPGTSRLRLTARADLTDDEIAWATRVVLAAVKEST